MTILKLKHNFYVVQVDCAVFGYGDTEQEALAMANEFIAPDATPLDVKTISQYVGQAKSSDHHAWKAMTQRGEMFHGEMVLLDRDTAERMGYKDP